MKVLGLITVDDAIDSTEKNKNGSSPAFYSENDT